MTAIEASNYFDIISSTPHQEAFRLAWWITLGIFIYVAIISIGAYYLIKRDEDCSTKPNISKKEKTYIYSSYLCYI